MILKSKLFSSLFVVTGCLVVLGPSLASCSSDCSDRDDCGPYMPPGGSAASGSGGDAGAPDHGGTAGTTAGKSGNSAGGSATEGGGGATSGTGGAGEGGEGGTSVTLPCDGACESPTPVCDESDDTCVECLEEQDCTGTKKKCDTDARACVECLESPHCTDAQLARCNAGTCVKCTANEDCAHIAGKTVCDTKAGECVQCTGTDYASCGEDAGTPLVCDSAKRTCTTNKEHSIGPCKACVSDAHCKLGQVCAKQQYGDPAEDVGFFCFWKQGDTANGAPANCAANGRPYVTGRANQVSIDGTTATICDLRLSTCTALNQFSSKDCTTAAAADDSKCGFDAPNDAKCVADGVGFTCTMTCASDDDRDCPAGIQCDTNATPPVCGL